MSDVPAFARFAGRVDIERIGPRAAPCVIVPSGYGYIRDDGIAAAPFGSLGP